MHDNISLEERIKLDNHVINLYKNPFNRENNYNYTYLVERTIPQLITRVDSEYFTRMPQMEKTKNAIHNMDGNRAPDPDGFRGCNSKIIEIYSRDICNQFT